MGGGTIEDLVREHPLTQIINDPPRSNQERIIKSVCRYTGGSARMYVQIPNYLLAFAKENGMTHSTLCTLATEGYFMLRRMLDHRYPGLMPLFRKIDEHKQLAHQLAMLDDAMDESEKRTEDRAHAKYMDMMRFKHRDTTRGDKEDARTRAVLRMEIRGLRRKQRRNLGHFWRHKRQVEYITELQTSQISGGGRPKLPQGIRGKEPTTYGYYDEGMTQLLTHTGEKLLGKYITKDICTATGGGTYVHISTPAYLKRHIDATGLQQSLFFILAIEDYLVLADSERAKRLNTMIVNLILHRASTARDTPEDRTRAVLFKERNRALAGTVRIYNNKKHGVKAKPRCTINEPVIRLRRDRITTNREEMTWGEIKEEDPDGFLEMVNDMWGEMSREQKKECDPKRFLREQRESGDVKESYGDDPSTYSEMDLPDVAELHPDVLASEVNKRWDKLNRGATAAF